MPRLRNERVVIVGAGVGGLSAALELASKGLEVLVLERATVPGGKMRSITVADHAVDAGPTVLTMPWILDEIFSNAGTSLAAELDLRPVHILARHAWSSTERLDLFADIERTQDAIGHLAGPEEGKRYARFCELAARTYHALEQSFLRAERPTTIDLVRHAGLRGLGALWRMSPFSSLSAALARAFTDPRLRQLFGRYATYCGASPFLAPATLMLIAHVERRGVWLVTGGMQRIAQAMHERACALGVEFRFGCEVAQVLIESGRVGGVRLADDTRIAANTVVVNADVSAVACGLLGPGIVEAAPGEAHAPRSLSALTWTLVARTSGFPLLRHSVFFSSDYAAEFDDIFVRARLPANPSVYVCAQDRSDTESAPAAKEERLLCLVNAPAATEGRSLDAASVGACADAAFGLLRRCGLHVERRVDASVVTTPADFSKLFPGTGGALYGRASHGWRSAFQRPGVRAIIPGLYFAGGSVHPGPGVPMAALSGQRAALCIREDLARASRRRSVAR